MGYNDKNQSPDSREVDNFHINSDKDRDRNAGHHSLGPGYNQSSPGSHKHDGTDSYQLLEGVTISGAKGGNTALASVIAALVGMGATDSTTA